MQDRLVVFKRFECQPVVWFEQEGILEVSPRIVGIPESLVGLPSPVQSLASEKSKEIGENVG